MSEINKKWAADSVDAIRITLLRGDFNIEGTDGNEVELEGEFESRRGYVPTLEPVGRWLPLSLWTRHGDTDFTLRLPRSKAWVVEFSAPTADLHVADIQARLAVRLGKGDVHIENCRGQFSVSSGNGDVEYKQCVEAAMPERPPYPEGTEPGLGPIPPIPNIETHGPKVDVGFGPHMRMRMNPRMRIKMRLGRDEEDESDEQWEEWDTEDWERWGEELGERATAWAEGFVAQMMNQFGGYIDMKGISLQLGRGDARLEDIEATDCIIRTANGDAELDGGRITNLNIVKNHGDIQIEDVLPVGEWDIELHHGDINLELPRDSRARLDVATRHGDIDSEVPLVRVGRPGRESRHGGRMVGTCGPSEGNVAQISLTTMKGDIRVKGPRGDGKRWEAPVAPPAPATPPTPPTPPVATVPPPPAVTDRSTDVPSTSISSSGRADDVPAGRATDVPSAPKYESQVAILQALSEGKISVAEAEQLLKSVR